MNIFDNLINKKVYRIYKLPQPDINPQNVVEDFINIHFSDDWRLTIFNPYKLLNAHQYDDYIGESIDTIDYGEENVIFHFTHNKNITVSIKDEDWNGPEAMILSNESLAFDSVW